MNDLRTESAIRREGLKPGNKTIIATTLFGGKALSGSAFRLLRIA
jgi:hypothetical protein